MKIIWASNAPHATSGYGIQTRHIVDGLRQMGHEVALAPNFGLQGGAIESGGMRIYPIYRDKIGQDVLPAHAKHFGADLVITLYDLWPYDVDFAARLKVPWAPYLPQDSYPPCPTVVDRARQADYPIAMSRFGLKSMAEQGLDCFYIPHGVDTNIYVPMDKQKARADLGLPVDQFIVLMVAANQSFPSRKAFPENLAAFAAFHRRHPESLLYLHTTRMPRGQAWDGVELPRLIKALGIEDAVIFTEEYALVLGLPDTEMAKIYNAADVLLAASMGEGFGIPILESQSCGVPVITTEFSSMTELTLNGMAVPPLQQAWTAINTWQVVPSIDGITQALELLYERPTETGRTLAQETRQAIIRTYSWSVVLEQWRVLLENIERGEEPRQERLYHYNIKGIELDVRDDKLSFTTGCVANELGTDKYGLEKIHFQPDDIVIDIGGHVGLFAMYVGKRWPEVRIFSFEPSATNYERFKRTLDSYQERGELLNVTVYHEGVTADAREIELSLDRGNTGGTTEFVKPNGHVQEQASSTTLDQILHDLTPPFVGAPDARIKLLKLDCEGAEYEILMSATCLDRIDHISGEFHINSILEAKGYSISGLYNHLKQYIPAERIIYSSCRIDE